MSQTQAATQSSRRGAAPAAANGTTKNAQGQLVQERTTKGSSASAPRVVHFVVGKCTVSSRMALPGLVCVSDDGRTVRSQKGAVTFRTYRGGPSVAMRCLCRHLGSMRGKRGVDMPAGAMLTT